MDSLARWDLELFRAIHLGLHRDFLDPVFQAISNTGLGWVSVAAVLLLIPLRPARRFVFPLLLSELIGGVFITDTLKALLQRARPSGLSFSVPHEHIFSKSFPSGHTTVAFSIAVALWMLAEKRQQRWVAEAATVWAILVGFSRIYLGVHWPTDVLGGLFAAVLGAAAGVPLGQALNRRLQKRTQNAPDCPNPAQPGAEAGT